MKTKNICPKCGTVADAAVQSRFCLECGADLMVSDVEQEAEEERKRKKIEEELKKAEEKRKRDEAAKRMREKNAQERKRAEEARKRREAEEARKRKEAGAEAKAKADEERKRKEANAARSSKVGTLKSKAEDALEWVVGALLIFVVIYSLFNGIPGFNGVDLKDTPADMIDWVVWEVEEITGSVPHKEGPIYRVSKETEYDSSGRIISEHSYDYDRRGNMTRQAHMTYYSDSTDSSGESYRYSDFDTLGCFHAYNSEGGRSRNVAYETSGDLVKKREYDSYYYDEYEYYFEGKLKATSRTLFDSVEKYEYDSNGFVRARSYGNNNSATTTRTYVWELDSAGNPKGYKFGFGTESEVASQGDNAEHQVFCDDDGNITTIRNSQGKVELEREYVKILRPSVFAWTKAHAIDLDYTNEE